MIGGRQVGNSLRAVSLDERRQRAAGNFIQDDARQGHAASRIISHIAVGSDFNMFRLSISPTVPPLMGRIRPSAKARVSGRKIADIIQIGSCSRSTTNNNGMTTWPTTRMVK